MRAVIAGAGAGILGGVVWYLIVRFTGYEVGWIAWGVGLAVGAAMTAATEVRSPALGVKAGLLAATGLLVGKFLIFQWMAGPALAQELESNPEIVRQMALWEMYENEELPADVYAEIDRLDAEEAEWPDELTMRVNTLVDAKLAEMGTDVTEQMAGVFRANVSPLAGVVASLSLFDILWFFLAIGTAWKMTAREAT